MSAPISPEAVREWRPDYLPAYVSNGLVGLRVGAAPPLGGMAVLESDFRVPGERPPERGVNHSGMLHRPLIALLGMAMGELWKLDDLAADCAQDGRYDFFLTCKPLNIPGGVGSPPNAMALK